MANLIPPNAKKQIMLEYWLRVFAVWLVLIGIGCIAVLILKLPTYITLRFELGAYADAHTRAEETIQASREAEDVIIGANQLVDVLAAQDTPIPFSEYIGVLDTIAGTDVKLNSMTFNQSKGVLSEIRVGGVARTRRALASFTNDVETHELFDEADLPISNLAKDSDITFSISIIPSSKQ